MLWSKVVQVKLAKSMCISQSIQYIIIMWLEYVHTDHKAAFESNIQLDMCQISSTTVWSNLLWLSRIIVFALVLLLPVKLQLFHQRIIRSSSSALFISFPYSLLMPTGIVAAAKHSATVSTLYLWDPLLIGCLKTSPVIWNIPGVRKHTVCKSEACSHLCEHEKVGSDCKKGGRKYARSGKYIDLTGLLAKLLNECGIWEDPVYWSSKYQLVIALIFAALSFVFLCRQDLLGAARHGSTMLQITAKKMWLPLSRMMALYIIIPFACVLSAPRWKGSGHDGFIKLKQ